jgi:glycine/D-amino acid oxidase-like deaminating enzyme/nitrite reductase/ring-hydroxylating ferredoxin subunit
MSEDSIWRATSAPLRKPPLTRDLETDVCIVGGGIAGLSCAYLLGRSGRRVVVLDDGPMGGGQTQQTTAHLSNVIDDRFQNIERWHGAEGARLAAESHAAAIDLIEDIARMERIDCSFERVEGYLFAPPGAAAHAIDQEEDAAARAGLAVSRLARAPLPAFDTGPCLQFARQAQFHPLAYLAGLAKAIERDGGLLFGDTHATKVEGGANARVETRGGPAVRSSAIVVATNSPVNDLVAIHTKQAAYLTYVIGMRVPGGHVPRALYWDIEEPYHYVRLHTVPGAPAGWMELLMVGGEDHKTGQAHDGEERFARLEEWARRRFGDLGAVERRWSGQVMETIDGLAFIGRNPADHDNVYVATGDSGMGLTHGTIAGMLLSDLIANRQNPWTALYDPSRKPVRAAGGFLRENLNVAAQYADLATPGEIDSTDEIPAGCGAVIRRGLEKVAVYRDPSGQLIERSAICPHLKCVVHWNDVAHTWDCPCHGSRFTATGEVICGPANSDLAASRGD